MKIIDLLNKIANGEKVPHTVLPKWFRTNMYLYHDMITSDYYNEEKTYELFGKISLFLNDEVEIIEKEKKAPTLNNIRESYGLPRIEEKKIPGKLKMLNANDHSKEVYYENYSKEEISLDIETLQIWVNKIIDYLDYLKSKGE